MQVKASRKIVGLLTVALPILVAGCASSPPSPASGSSGAQNPGYQAARAQWLKSPPYVGTAGQGIPLLKAVADLDHGMQTDRGKAEYPKAVSYLEGMIHSPDTNPTPEQNQNFRRATEWLDTFFDTPRLFKG